MSVQEPDVRLEHDALGTVEVPARRCWGAQTQRSLMNFAIGTERMPEEIIRAFALLKKAAAIKAALKLSELPSLAASANESPTASPSGILCKVIAKNKRVDFLKFVFGPSLIPLIICR